MDDFKVIKLLGRGGFGKVMLVKEKKTSKYYALKAIKKIDVINKEQVENTLTERDVLE